MSSAITYVLVRSGSVMEVSATERLEDNDSGNRCLIPGPGGGPLLQQLPTYSASVTRNVSPLEVCHKIEELTGEQPKEQLIYKV